MHYDIAVIGMGLSGLMAAKTAADANRKVLLIGKGTGSLCLFSNTIDVLAAGPEDTTLTESLSRWIKARPDHPYSKVGQKKIGEALSSFVSFFPPPYGFRSFDDRNSLILTGAGTLRPTYLLPATITPSNGRHNTLIVGFEGFKDFYAGYASRGLDCRAITLPVRDTGNQEITGALLSRLMETDSFRREITREIRKTINNETRVGLPAVLGLNDPCRVKRKMEETLGVEIFEIPTLPPSLPGRRIFNRFNTWLVKKGVTVLMGHPVSKAAVNGKRCEGVYVSHPPVESFYPADRFILATGRFMGGGLAADRDKIAEPVFDLPIAQPQSREGWFEKSFSDCHPVHGSGVLTDALLRPVDPEGNLLFENVWVAGSILAHHHLIEEKSREGIEITTGYMAAQQVLGL